jgi:hypothetical protein
MVITLTLRDNNIAQGPPEIDLALWAAVGGLPGAEEIGRRQDEIEGLIREAGPRG